VQQLWNQADGSLNCCFLIGKSEAICIADHEPPIQVSMEIINWHEKALP
jgi:hypothetical protein